MKKILIIISCLFTATTVSYAKNNMAQSDPESSDHHSGFFESDDNDSPNEIFDDCDGFFENDANNSFGETSDDYDGFFRASDADNPIVRPGAGGGIGQQTPVGDGWVVLIVCCAGWIIVKLLYRRRRFSRGRDKFTQ
ncbi:MAG: hypothetical protein FWF53_12520 [Candidatus Azobacteroides sp.]|nr:hypothetical protein [Candidatus Azobacteroides sp.]